MFRKKELISAALIVGAFIVLFAVEMYISNISPMAGASETLLLFFLWNIVIILFLTLVFVLGRTFFKLYIERKKMALGAQLKTKLVMFFFLFSLVPTIMIFFFASDIIGRSVESWFKTPMDKVVEEIDSVSKEFYESWKPHLLHYAKLIRGQVKGEESFKGLFNKVRGKMIEYNIDLISIYDRNGEIFTLLNPSLPLRSYRDVSSMAINKGMIGEDTCVMDRMEKGDIIRCIASKRRASHYIVIVGKFVPQSISQKVALLESIVTRYREMKLLSNPMKTTYMLLLILLSILILFSSSWVGIHLAKNITQPVERLLSATEELSKGNFSVKIEHESSDEIGLLVNAFNRMVEDLRKQRGEIEERKNYIEIVLDTINPGVIGISKEGKIISANPSARKILNLEGKIGLPLEEAVEDEETKKILKEGMDKGVALDSREVVRKKGGETSHLVINFVPIRKGKQIKGGIVVIEDITPIMNTQKMEVWREVATRVAHEIKNPLTPIKLSAQRIISKLQSPNPDIKEIESAAKTILSETVSIKSLAEDFSQMARMPQLRRMPYSLKKLLGELYESYRTTYSEIKFSLEVDENLPEILYFDPDQMKRAVRNLLNNAVEAVGKGDSIKLRGEADLEKGIWRIIVKDTGPGISDEDKSRIFTPYFSRKKGGSGLGLPIVMHIIREHNGKIYVRDNKPRGTEFIIEVPV